MRQRIERAGQVAKGRRKKIGPKGLLTLTGVTREMIRIYVAARTSELDVQQAGTMIRMLERIRLALAGTIYDERITHLEEIVGTRDGARPVVRSDGCYSYDDLDAEEARLQ